MTAHVSELIALAALGELTDAQQAELDQACAADADVGRELRAALTAAATLQSAHRVAPPVRLRARVLDAIDSVPQQPAVPRPPQPAEVVSLADRRRPWTGWLVGAAAAVLVAVAGMTAVAVGNQPQDDPVAAVLEADDAVDRVLTGTLDGTLTVTSSRTQDAVVVVGRDLEPLADDRTLQLWLIDDAAPVSVGTFRPDESGEISVRFDDVATDDVVLGVTVEPPGGSESPTLPIVATA
jgi:anti-sigma-K factor RskA